MHSLVETSTLAQRVSFSLRMSLDFHAFYAVLEFVVEVGHVLVQVDLHLRRSFNSNYADTDKSSRSSTSSQFFLSTIFSTLTHDMRPNDLPLI